MSSSEAEVPKPADVSGPRGVYVHVPWCSRRCSYCDFYLRVGKVDGRFAARVLEQWVATQALLGNPATLRSLYFGGGTPGLLPLDALTAVVRGVAAVIPLEPGAEVTLEVNPNDVTEASVAGWLSAGVTRISLGVQSLHDNVLTWLGRDHDGVAARRALALLGGAGFASISADLIMGAPVQTMAMLQSDVEALAATVPHVSAYVLTYEPGTKLERMVSLGRVGRISGDQEADQYAQVQRWLGDAGYAQYEVSSHARPGHHAVHNRLYWAGQTTLGLGPAAASYLRYADGSAHRYRNAPDLRGFLDGRHAQADADPLAPLPALLDRVFVGLRDLERGVDLPQLEAEHRVALPPDSARGLAAECAAGVLEALSPRHYRLTPPGALWADRVARGVLAPGP